ncbi:MAG TPA: alpha/beta hydrolase fold domain-containing protein, partial [Gemmataceae bacterium]|nr:alpha/beta hydrolase fold domain-containing protein [Gemmataceae bacterium]
MRYAWMVPLVMTLGFSWAAGADDRPAAGDDKRTVLELWPGKAPDEIGDIGEEKTLLSPKLDRKQVEVTEPTQLVTNVTTPTITVYRPAKDKDVGTAIVICPGGGYWNLYWQLEGEEVATWLNSLGVTGVILKYRVPRRPDEPKAEPARRPLQDAQRAVSLVRSKAKEWGIAPDHIGVMGFSAGGHLAIAAATSFDKRSYRPIDAIDEISCRPDFAVAVYSGYLKDKDKDELAPGLHIPKGTPPIFLAHGDADLISDPENSVLLYEALHQAGVSAELHVYAGTAHDFGVRPSDRPCSTWTKSCADWLRDQGFLARVRPKPEEARKDDGGPWGVASGAEWSGDYPKFNPMLHEAGVRWLRLFPEWQVIQPKKDQWDWHVSDDMTADARANGIHLSGILCYLAPWASADGGTRKFPIKDIQYWRDYVGATVGRYKNDIQYWEIWNEFNGSFGDSKNKVKDYAELVVTAYDAAKKANPDAKIGLTVANFDVGFLDAVIKAGAADHFDFVCVHPYENLNAVADGGEVGYLSLAGNLRKMLAANKQRTDIPLWITEVGFQAPVKPDAPRDAMQADLLVKAYVLSLAQGFERIFWFEARGPAYGKGTDHGVIRPDWTPRPAYDALRTMTTLLGPEPHYVGWLDVGKGGYGFVFQGDKGTVLTAWSPAHRQIQAKFDGAVTVTDLAGKQSALPGGQELALTNGPVFISDLPADLVKQARSNVGKPYPWAGDYANAKVVSCRLAAANTEDGLQQVNPKTTVVVKDGSDAYRRPDFADPDLKNEGRYIYFRVDPQFVPFGTKELEITIAAKRLAPDKDAGMGLCYESAKGYTGVQG